MPFIVTIMGNIGSGKSTLIKYLQDFNYHVIQEPVEKWSEWLTLFYTDPKQYSFSFQMKVLIDFSQLIKDVKDDIIIIERSPIESKEIFAKTLFQDNMIKDIEYNLLCDYHDVFAWKPNIIIYLKSSPVTCSNRIKSRNRGCEHDIELSYLQKLNNNYDSFIANNKDIPILTIDANRSEIDVRSEVYNLMATIVSTTVSSK